VFGFVIGTVILYVSGSMFDKRNLFETNDRVMFNEQISKTFHLIRIKLARGLYEPGHQYVNLFVDREKKPYTPIKYNNDVMTFSIKYYDKRFSNKLTDLYIKDKVVYCKGAFGNNFYDPLLDSFICNNKEITKHNILMLSCGTGITPFYSLLTSFLQK